MDPIVLKGEMRKQPMLPVTVPIKKIKVPPISVTMTVTESLGAWIDLKGLFTLTAATATETQIFFPSRMGYIEPYRSVHMETCGKGNSNP